MTKRSNTPYRLQRAIEDDPEVKERICLHCTLAFISQWAGNRICDVCKGLWTYKTDLEITEYGTFETGQRSKARTRD